MYDDLPDFALSIRQPWAWAILNAGKDIENRSWRTSRRGRIALHAGRGMTLDEYTDCFRTWMAIGREFDFPDSGNVFPSSANLERGGIVGTADLVDCVMTSASPWFFGKFGFVLADVRPVPFIAVSGAQGWFRWKERVL